MRLYAPLPAASLGYLTSRLAYAAPQLYPHVRRVQRAAEQSLAHGRVAGTRWYWPADETPQDFALAGRPRVRLLAPFDPVVWDRRRFEQFWGWAYRFEAYTPKPKRKLGYYALPLLWHERVIGWGNLRSRAAGCSPRSATAPRVRPGAPCSSANSPLSLRAPPGSWGSRPPRWISSAPDP